MCRNFWIWCFAAAPCLCLSFDTLSGGRRPYNTCERALLLLLVLGPLKWFTAVGDPYPYLCEAVA